MIVYADNAATTKMSTESIYAMNEVMMDWTYGNPSSAHRYGTNARTLLDSSREKIAKCINAYPDEIYFTSGGTESDNWAIMICAPYFHACSAIEHHAMIKTIGHDEDDFLIPVSHDGITNGYGNSPWWLEDSCFVSVMLANNEIGTIQPVKELAAICHKKDIIFHTDAVQAVGHIPIDVKDLGVDMLSASAHKFHGPKGVGFLYVKRGTFMTPLLCGGGQERGLRSGTENLPGIVGMATALGECCRDMDATMERVTAMRDKLIGGLLEMPGTHINGSLEHRLPGNVNVRFDGIEGGALVAMLDNKYGIAISTGAACTTGDLAPSHVLKAIGLSDKQARSSVRITLGRYNTMEEVDYILKSVRESVTALRNMGVM